MHMSHAEHVLAHFTPPCVSFVMLLCWMIMHDHVDDHFSGTLKHTSTQSYITINTYIIIMTKNENTIITLFLSHYAFLALAYTHCHIMLITAIYSLTHTHVHTLIVCIHFIFSLTHVHTLSLTPTYTHKLYMLFLTVSLSSTHSNL